MSNTKLVSQNFEMVSGDDRLLRFTVTDQDGAVQSLVGALAVQWAMAKSNRSPIVVTKALGSGISISDAANGVIDVTLDASDTDSLRGDYYHECQVTDASGDRQTVAYGTATILRDLIES